MAFSKDKNDYRTFVRPDKPVTVEKLVDEFVVRGPYSNPASISWEALRDIALDESVSMCIVDDMRRFRFGHELGRVYARLADRRRDGHLSVLECRTFGTCAERLGWIEYVRDEELDLVDARREWQRQSAIETDDRKKKFGGLRDVDDLPDGTLSLLLKAAHQTFVGVLSLGTPLSSASEEEIQSGTGWQSSVSVPGSDTCCGGQYDVMVVGKHTGKRVLCDIKLVDHSVDAHAVIRFNPKNQAQLILYLIAIAIQDVRDDEIPTGLAWINPLRGVVEYVTADTLLRNRTVIRTLASKALCLPEDIVEKVDERLTEVWTASLD